MALQTGALRGLQDRFGAGLEREIDRWFARVAPEALFPGMMRYQMGTVDARLQPVGRTGGKRFRPMLCLLCTELCGGEVERALPAGAAIEILHNFSLVHDDIEDHDPDRRHRPTVWKVWGEPQALNAGDGMHALASRAVLALDVPAQQTLEIATAFTEMALELTRGQFLDMSFETRTDVSAAEYMEMISLKSAAIISFSAWAGAVIAGAPGDTRDALRSYGRHLGRAFQIEDDIQGIWGRPEETGKQPATDIRNRKKTLPVLLALEGARGETAKRLTRFYAGNEEDLDTVLAAIDSLGVREQAMVAGRRELSLALEALDRADLGEGGRDQLAALAYELTGNARA